MLKNKSITLLVMCLLTVSCWAAKIVIPYDRDGVRVDPGQLHTIKNQWVILDSTTSTGSEPSDLAVTERTYQLVKAAIAAAASGDDEISIFDIIDSI